MMVEVKVTYETLFDLLRKEKSRNELQELENTFFSDVVSYLKEKSSMLQQTGVSTSRAEQERIKIQIKNVKRILKELYELREKKILNLAMNKVRTGSDLIDTSKMLSEEMKLFEEATVILKKFQQEILMKITHLETPEIESPPAEMERPAEEKAPAEESQTEEKPASNGSLKVKFLSNLPKFMGLDKKVYGPYDKDSTGELPSNVAELLLKKGRAELVS